ncbi:glycosyltransferase [Labilibacter sediminis]|nr:glycosyltransferase [Labilibacter sediminis]
MADHVPHSICFVIPNFVTFSTGGAEIQVHYLSQAFLERGWRVEVVCAGVGHEKEIVESPFYNRQITYHYYQKKKIRSLEFFSVLKSLKKTSSRYYYQRTDFALTAATLWFCKFKKQKMIYALASDSDAQRGKYLTLFKEYSYSSQYKKNIRKLDFLLLDKMIECAKRNSDYVICQSKQQVIDFKKNFNKTGEIISNSFVGEAKTEVQKENVVLWVGNNNPVKRPWLFVQLAAMFAHIPDWRFVMIGSACELIQEFDIPDNLDVVGALSYDETNQWFLKSKVCVNTSIKEGLPNTFILSWWCKTLVMSLEVNPDGIFNNHKNGYCFDNDLKDLSIALNKVMDRSLDTESAIKNGEEHLKQHFNLDKNINKLLKIIS